MNMGEVLRPDGEKELKEWNTAFTSLVLVCNKRLRGKWAGHWVKKSLHVFIHIKNIQIA